MPRLPANLTRTADRTTIHWGREAPIPVPRTRSRSIPKTDVRNRFPDDDSWIPLLPSKDDFRLIGRPIYQRWATSPTFMRLLRERRNGVAARPEQPRGLHMERCERAAGLAGWVESDPLQWPIDAYETESIWAEYENAIKLVKIRGHRLNGRDRDGRIRAGGIGWRRVNPRRATVLIKAVDNDGRTVYLQQRAEGAHPKKLQYRQPEVSSDKPLNPQQQSFVAAYLECHEARRAAVMSGYAPATGPHLLTQPNIRAALDAFKDAVMDERDMVYRKGLRTLDDIMGGHDRRLRLDAAKKMIDHQRDMTKEYHTPSKHHHVHVEPHSPPSIQLADDADLADMEDAYRSYLESAGG